MGDKNLVLERERVFINSEVWSILILSLLHVIYTQTHTHQAMSDFESNRTQPLSRSRACKAGRVFAQGIANKQIYVFISY